MNFFSIAYICVIFSLSIFFPRLTSSTLVPYYVIGVDAGTESCRVGIFDLTSDHPGIPVSQAAVKYTTTFPRPGFAEQKPQEWWDSFGAACKEAIANKNIDIECIHALSVDTTACSVVSLDKYLKPLRNCLLWMDTRAAKQCDEILSKAKGDPALRVNNNGVGPLSAEWMIPKALWIKQHEPSLWSKIHVLCEKQDYFNLKMTDRLCASACNVAARWHWNAEDACYASRRDILAPSSKTHEKSSACGRPVSLLKKIGMLDALDKWPQECVAMGETVGYLTKGASQHLGLKPGIRVVQGGPDAYVAMLGLGCVESGKLSLITGSSHLHLAISPANTGKTYSASGIWGNYFGAPLLGLSFAEGVYAVCIHAFNLTTY